MGRLYQLYKEAYATQVVPGPSNFKSHWLSFINVLFISSFHLVFVFNMKLSLLVTAAIVPLVSAHYFFDTLIIDGQESTPNQYVRSNTRSEKYNPTKWINTRDDLTPDMPDFRCNKAPSPSPVRPRRPRSRLGRNLP